MCRWRVPVRRHFVACIIPSTYTDCITPSCRCKMHNTGSSACYTVSVIVLQCYTVSGNIRTVALQCTVDKCYSEQADKPHCPAQVLPECNVCNVFARSTTYNSLWRLRNDSRGIFFMQWPTEQMRHFLCSCFIDRPGSLSLFFAQCVHRVQGNLCTG